MGAREFKEITTVFGSGQNKNEPILLSARFNTHGLSLLTTAEGVALDLVWIALMPVVGRRGAGTYDFP